RGGVPPRCPGWRRCDGRRRARGALRRRRRPDRGVEGEHQGDDAGRPRARPGAAGRAARGAPGGGGRLDGESPAAVSQPTIIPFHGPADYRRHAPRVAAHLREGGLVAYPTETVYGLGCALRSEALARLARLKRQGRARPFLLLVRTSRDAPGLEWTEHGRRLAQAFWPGPLTLVLRAAPARYPAEVTGEQGT